MNYSIEFIVALVFVFIASLLWVAAKVLKINVPVVYGRHEIGESRFRISTRLSWVLMESPACLVFTYFVFTGQLSVTPPVIVLLIM